jgi:hypothetical protein
LGNNPLILDFTRACACICSLWERLSASIIAAGKPLPQGEKPFTQVGPQQAFDIFDTTCFISPFSGSIFAFLGREKEGFRRPDGPGFKFQVLGFKKRQKGWLYIWGAPMKGVRFQGLRF